MFNVINRGGAFAEWDFSRGLNEGWVPPIPPIHTPSTMLYGSCYDILEKTEDNESIVHEFPDPSSLDLKNWQGFDTDDDVVVSHGMTLEKNMNDEWVEPTAPLRYKINVPFWTPALLLVYVLAYHMSWFKFKRSEYYPIDETRSQALEMSI